MYPNLYYVFKDFFNVDLPFLKFINSFGFFVAISFLVAAAVLTKELKRKSQLGLMQPTEEELTVGEPATAGELITNFILGFIVGYKLLALFFLDSSVTTDPQAYIFSGQGNLLLGLLIGGAMAFWKWREKKKQQLQKPEKRKVRLWPHDRVGEFTVLALVFGLIGAKLFDIFENWSDFLKRPSEYILSGGGLTFYGGLILATIAIVMYARKYKIPIRHLADAIAPPLMIAYAIGRIGCQVAGDGDWGIYNSAFAVDDNHQITQTTQPFDRSILAHSDYFSSHYRSISEIPHKSVSKPAALKFLPDWLFAYDYPHNVNDAGVRLNGCDEPKYCNHLPAPVFPTPFYETIMCTILFFVLWAVRKRLKVPGTLFALYLIVNGIERFMIETIRVNNKMDFFGLQPTQAEVIAAGLVIVGIGIWIFLNNKYRTSPK